MNLALEFLHQNRERLGLVRYQVPEDLASLVLTPRFRTSSHVVFLILDKSTRQPVLVVKVPRLAGLAGGVEREARVLKTLQEVAPAMQGSVPELVAYESYAGRPVLVQTGLSGRLMDPPSIRADREQACQAVINWLVQLHGPRDEKLPGEKGWFASQVERPLCYLEEALPLTRAEGELLEQTRDALLPLSKFRIPPVIEHGDLSHPNLIALKKGGVGVVDWESAEIPGLPACDLFFFLSYVATTVTKKNSVQSFIKANQATFLEPDAWSYGYILAYAEQLGLPLPALRPLFLLTWLRTIVRLLERMEDTKKRGARLSAETTAWLRANRYYAMWQHSAAHIHDFMPALPGV